MDVDAYRAHLRTLLSAATGRSALHADPTGTAHGMHARAIGAMLGRRRARSTSSRGPGCGFIRPAGDLAARALTEPELLRDLGELAAATAC